MQTELNLASTALVLVDPHVDLLSSSGAAWDLVGEQVTKRGIVDRLVGLRAGAEAAGIPVLYSRIEVTEADYASWTSHNGLQALMAERKLMLRGGGARFHPRLEPTPTTVLLSPRTGPSAVHSDLTVQLRRRGIETVLVAGMIANLCVESHARDLTEQGFNVLVVGDAIATLSDAIHEATLGNLSLLATEVVGYDDALAELASA